MSTTDLLRDLLGASNIWHAGGLDPRFAQLSRLAVEALHREDQIVRDAILEGRATFDGGYDQVSPGLAYWVFETGLVYTLWKAWVPAMVCRWEHPYGPGTSKAADLVLFPSPDQGWVFEAKWFNSNAKLTRDVILADLAKLNTSLDGMTHPLAGGGGTCQWRRFLIWFSWGDPSELAVDWDPFDRFVGDQQRFQLVAIGAFPSKIYKSWGRKDRAKEIEGYFSVAFVEVV